MNHRLDASDKRLVYALNQDGRASIGDLASKLGLSAPTVRSHLRRLTDAGILKTAGLLNACDDEGLIVAIVGLNIKSYGALGKIVDKLVQLDGVTWAAVVTGRFDVLAEVVVEGGVSELYRLTTELIPAVGVVDQTETFVVMSGRNKWVNLPKHFKAWSDPSSKPKKNSKKQKRIPQHHRGGAK
jgi:DNA-binding Lrp family transcriptional regulator